MMTATIGPFGIALLVGLASLLLAGGGGAIIVGSSSRLVISLGLIWALLGALVLNVVVQGLA